MTPFVFIKRTLLFVIFITTVPFYLSAQQVSINTDGADPDASAVLDLVATDKGLLVPRMSSAERAGIANPAKGLLVFDNDTKTFWFYNGGVWINFEANLPDKLVDGNFDTSVKVDLNGGDDNIYFTNGGTTTWRMTDKALEPLNNGNSVFIGKDAGANDNHDDNRNVFIGTDAGKTNGAGHSNLAIGYKSLELNGIGNENTALGDNTLTKNNSGHANTATGAYALDANTEGDQNTANGGYALSSNTTGNKNTALGHKAMFSNTTANANVGLGTAALYNNTDRSGLVAVGDSSLFSNGQNVTLGIHATGNTAVGAKSLFGNTTGYYGTALGHKSLFSNTTGAQNTAIGYTALKFNTTGFNNTTIGFATMQHNVDGFNNTALGKTALWSNTSGDDNIAIGMEALFSNETGEDNVAIGNDAGGGNVNGSGNIFIGKSAGSNETGSNKLYIDNSSTNTPLIGGNFQSNEVTINGTVKITGGVPAAGRVLTSNATGEAAWEEIPNPSKTIILGPYNFQSGDNRAIKVNYARAYGKSDNAAYLICPLKIPVGSTISEITIYYTDTYILRKLSFGLLKRHVSNASTGDFTDTFLFQSSNDDGVQSNTYDVPISIENDYVYSIRVRPRSVIPDSPNNNWGPDSQLSVAAIKITYTE